jgi:hypothetical protein
MKNFVVLGMILLSTFHGFGQKLINNQPDKKAIAESSALLDLQSRS